MHPSRPSLLGFPGEHGRVPRRILSPPMLLCSDCLLWLTARLRTPLCSRPLRAYSHLENCESRNSLEVSQSCGLKNDLLCCRPLRAQQALVQQTFLGPSSHLEHRDASRSGRAHCVRWVSQLFQKPSLSCHRWVMTGQDDWTSRCHHSPITDGPGQLGARSHHSPVSLDGPGDWTLKHAGF